MKEEYVGWLDDEWNTVLDQSQPIVRCRDCKEYRPELYNHIACELLGRYVEPNGFCAWGERRDA